MHVNTRHEWQSVEADHLLSGLKHFSIVIRHLKPCGYSTKMPLHSCMPELCPAGLCDSNESLLIRRETCAIISVCLSILDHRRGAQIWFMICCLMAGAAALALRGDQMTFSTGACQGRNGECTITTGWQREWERPPVLRLNGGEMLLKSDGKMIPVNTAKGGGVENRYGWRDAERFLMPVCLRKAASGLLCLHKTSRNNDGPKCNRLIRTLFKVPLLCVFWHYLRNIAVCECKSSVKIKVLNKDIVFQKKEPWSVTPVLRPAWTYMGL